MHDEPNALRYAFLSSTRVVNILVLTTQIGFVITAVIAPGDTTWEESVTLSETTLLGL